MSIVSRAIRNLFSVFKQPNVRMLCNRSHSLTMITLMSLAIARTIFLKFSAIFSCLDLNFIFQFL